MPGRDARDRAPRSLRATAATQRSGSTPARTAALHRSRRWQHRARGARPSWAARARPPRRPRHRQLVTSFASGRRGVLGWWRSAAAAPARLGPVANFSRRRSTRQASRSPATSVESRSSRPRTARRRPRRSDPDPEADATSRRSSAIAGGELPGRAAAASRTPTSAEASPRARDERSAMRHRGARTGRRRRPPTPVAADRQLSTGRAHAPRSSDPVRRGEDHAQLTAAVAPSRS